ncbi:FtsX-like permease family protein [Micromonospora mirobrigensis]|uniref:Putative ABC transport system permease protein n=1 Tax=Micromonospora mirobrigensis TaxID=262898 RepID=A0A1C4TXA4_9ACTN|nr:FtsX-like permease family protein [Micromonospora mirobrigensis]SCE64027.1 putative ABC transport system permease protein [Micromonospora mirobrigensis]
MSRLGSARRPAAPVDHPGAASRRRTGSRRALRLAAWFGSWRAALRIARREARRARGRTALVLAMIMLPVLALTFVAVSYDMARLTRAEELDRRLGVADADLRAITDRPIRQDAWGSGPWSVDEGTVRMVPPGTVEEITALLPPGSRAVPVHRWVPFEVRRGDRDQTIAARALDLADPLARAHARLLSGRAPAGADEIAVSRAALSDLPTRVGDRVTVADGSRSYRVVGVVEFPDDLGVVVALHPSAVGRTQPSGDAGWLVDLPGGVDDDLVRRLNAHGVLVAARAPVPGAPLPRADTGADATDWGNGVLVGGLGLLEVVLLVGPAFAVGVRRRRRDLALVAVAGGDAAQLRRVVLADGVVLGALGAAAGLALGVAAAFAGRPLVEQYLMNSRFGGYRCFPAALATIALVAVVAGVLAALAPAWTAARHDVVAGLAGRRSAPPHRRRWLLIGVVLTLAGTGLATFGAARTNPTWVLAGLVLGELGLVFVTPALLGVLARAGRLLPLAPRIALRDASRNRSSAAPAISAVMAAVAGSVAIGVYLAGGAEREAGRYRPALPPGHVLVTRTDGNGTGPLPQLSLVAELARTQLPGGRPAPLAYPACATGDGNCDVSASLPPGRACPYDLGPPLSRAEQRAALADPRCDRSDGYYSGPSVGMAVVDDGSALPGLTGAGAEAAAAATAVLRAGGVVVDDPRRVVDGRVTLRVNRTDDRPEPVATTTTTVPGYALTDGIRADRLILSPAAAARVGLVGRQLGWVVATDRTPNRGEQDRFTRALREHLRISVEVERGPSEQDRSPQLLLLALAAGVVTVGASAIATGLAAAEGRADLSTLAAVGAGPGVRRLLSLCQAGVIAGTGSVLGIAAGLGTAVIILTAVNRRYAESWPVEPPYPLVVPASVAAVVVVVPVVAMLGAGLFTRSRLPVERRLD